MVLGRVKSWIGVFLDKWMEIGEAG